MKTTKTILTIWFWLRVAALLVLYILFYYGGKRMQITEGVLNLFYKEKTYVQMSTSMEPEIPGLDRLKCVELSSYGEIERNDFIIYRYEGKQYLSRVIGLPGELVKISHETVFVNGEPLEEDYVLPENQYDIGGVLEFSLREGEYIVLGDNRAHSIDSRSMGTLTEDGIQYKAEPIGSLFIRRFDRFVLPSLFILFAACVGLEAIVLDGMERRKRKEFFSKE